MLTEITEDGIKSLVHQFYGKIVKDAQLGPLFNQTIAPEDWPKHLNTMCDFWSSIMLKTRRYQGNPLQKHLGVPPFDAALFGRWLELFAETALEIFTPDIAIEFQEASQNIARSLKYALYGRP